MAEWLAEVGLPNVLNRPLPAAFPKIAAYRLNTTMTDSTVTIARVLTLP